MTQEIEQLDIFVFLNEPTNAGGVTVEVQVDDGIKVGQRVQIVDETKFPPFVQPKRSGYRNGVTATVVGIFGDGIDILLDEAHWGVNPRRVPSSVYLTQHELENGAVEIMGNGE